MKPGSSSETPQVYPSPTIVVGVGRLGLAVLEQLGEDWLWLERTSGGDSSIRNLRLIHVRPRPEAEAHGWRESERTTVRIARHIGCGDLPSLAVDFVVLRALGLVRFRDGTYQVAVPKDAGLVEPPGTPEFIGEERRESIPRRRVVRRRFFEWQNLSPDPLVAADRLREVADARSELDLFITPIINRVRQGHSPQILLACVGRCRALAQGRDPSPWTWTRGPLAAAGRAGLSLSVDPAWLSDHDREGLLEGFAPKPLPAWPDAKEATEMLRDPAAVTRRALVLRVPATFIPEPADPSAPLEPLHLLRVNWEATGWATEALGPDDAGLAPIESSPFRLGLFDHDGTRRVALHGDEHLRERLQQLALHLHRGLVRLWVDLGRIHVRGQPQRDDQRMRENLEVSTAQCLEILGELLVRPVIADRGESGCTPPPERHDDWLDGEPLAEEATPFLRGMTLEERVHGSDPERQLEERLHALGQAAAVGRETSRRPLLREILLDHEDLHRALALELGEVGDTEPPRPEDEARGLLELRAALNDEVRRLFDYDYLSTYRQTPTRRPPRLCLFVVGDVGEPFVRAFARTVVRETHAELLRAFAPIFVTYRAGIDRALSIVPILWMPHPADAFGGRHPDANRCEEAVIIEAVHGMRRWAEGIPPESRCIPQIFVNGRVTDNAVISVADAVRQTRDFLTLLVRNRVGGDDFLRQVAAGSAGIDLFSSFACYGIDFPARRAREYLANRLGREFLGLLKDASRSEPVAVDGAALAPPDTAAITAAAEQRLGESTRAVAERLGVAVETRIPVAERTDAEDLIAAFDDTFEHDLLERIQKTWGDLSRNHGLMDAQVDELRRVTSAALGRTIQSVRQQADTVVHEAASRNGLAGIRTAFNTLREHAGALLRERETAKKRGQGLCHLHRIPQTAPVKSARANIVAAALMKPHAVPMLLGLFAWAAMAPALGAPIAHATAKYFELHLRPNVLEVLLGPLGWLAGGLLLVVPAALVLHRLMQRALRRVREAVHELGHAARCIVHGASDNLDLDAASVRSFFSSRLRFADALAARSFVLGVYEQVIADGELAARLNRSVDIQEVELRRRAEEGGVRPALHDNAHRAETDDVGELFATRARGEVDRLIRPERLHDYFVQKVPEVELKSMLPDFLKTTGGFERWRDTASLSDTDAILEFGRRRFAELVATPVARQSAFVDEVGERLLAFVARNYPNIGFGAKFIGYEGLDPDGVRILANAALLVHPELREIYEEARRKPGAPPTTETLVVLEAAIRRETAYLISVVQDIRAHSVANLRRFESFLDRAHIPDGSIFPQADEATLARRPPINALTWHADLRGPINDPLVAPRPRRHGDPKDGSGEGGA